MERRGSMVNKRHHSKPPSEQCQLVSVSKATRLKIQTEPCCLVSISEEGRLRLNSAVLEELRCIKGQLVVLAITGRQKTGKSFLMNRIAGGSSGFEVGASIRGQTKGIWIWVRPHPRMEGVSLVLLDTEGLQNAERGHADNDFKIFTLATLLSSTLLYNIHGQIDENIVNMLNFVSAMARRLRSKHSHSLEEALGHPLHFVLVIRDFCLELDRRGVQITADEYLEGILQTRSDRSVDYNEPRGAITSSFRRRKCFTLDRPARRKQLKNLSTLTDDQLQEDFLLEVKQLQEYLLCSEPMLNLFRQPVDGEAYATLILEYLSAVEDGTIPSVRSSYRTTVDDSSREACDGGIQMYKSYMERELKNRLTDEETLLHYHYEAFGAAMKHFQGTIVDDSSGISLQKFLDGVSDMHLRFLEQNKLHSQRKCEQILRELESRIMYKIEGMEYNKPQGFMDYWSDTQSLISSYLQTDLGVAKSQVFTKYMKKEQERSWQIHEMDKQLTLDQRRAEESSLEALELHRKKEEMSFKRMAADSHQNVEQEVWRLRAENERLRQGYAEQYERELSHAIRESKTRLEQEYQHVMARLSAENENLKRKTQELEQRMAEQQRREKMILQENTGYKNKHGEHPNGTNPQDPNSNKPLERKWSKRYKKVKPTPVGENNMEVAEYGDPRSPDKTSCVIS